MCPIKDWQNFFIIFTFVYIMPGFCAFKWRYWRHWKTCYVFTCFSCRWSFRIVLTSINYFYYTFQVCINNGASSGIWYWLNSNILVYWGITTLLKALLHYKYLYFQILFMRFLYVHCSDNKNHLGSDFCLGVTMPSLSVWNH